MDGIKLTPLKNIYHSKGSIFKVIKKAKILTMVLVKLIFQQLIKVKLKVGKNIQK